MTGITNKQVYGIPLFLAEMKNDFFKNKKRKSFFSKNNQNFTGGSL